jgi:hypothetical protein
VGVKSARPTPKPAPRTAVPSEDAALGTGLGTSSARGARSLLYTVRVGHGRCQSRRAVHERAARARRVQPGSRSSHAPAATRRSQSVRSNASLGASGSMRRMLWARAAAGAVECESSAVERGRTSKAGETQNLIMASRQAQSRGPWAVCYRVRSSSRWAMRRRKSTRGRRVSMARTRASESEMTSSHSCSPLVCRHISAASQSSLVLTHMPCSSYTSSEYLAACYRDFCLVRLFGLAPLSRLRLSELSRVWDFPDAYFAQI